MTTTETKTRTQDDVVGEIIAKLGHESFGTGPLAELRRMNPRTASPSAPALHRLLARYVPEAWLAGEGLNRWALLINLLALASPLPLRGHLPLGEGMYAAGYHEGRLTMLLEAQAEDFPVILPRLVRFLVAKGSSPHPYQLARLVLGGGREADRMTIARTFYRAEARTNT